MQNNTIEKEINYCVVIPTYNNERTLESVIEGVLKITDRIIIVNDGSTDNTARILEKYAHLEIVTHAINKGKGKALRNAFKRAFELGYEYAITIDSDGQHVPADIPILLKGIEENRGALVMGARNMSQEGIPQKSSFGNKFSSFWYWAETGNKLSDTQSGFRAYPLEPISKIKWVTNKFEFEIEVLVRLAWVNVGAVEVPVQVIYPEDRVSHFRPAKDFIRISMLNTVLFTLAVAFFLPRSFFFHNSPKEIVRKIKEEVLRNIDTPTKLAGAIAMGLFFGVAPIWGFQMMVAFVFASIFKLNRTLVLLVSNISTPPFIPLIVFTSFLCGAIFVSEPVELSFNLSEITLETVFLQLRQYVIGAFVLATGLAVIGFSVTYVISSSLQRKKAQ